MSDSVPGGLATEVRLQSLARDEHSRRDVLDHAPLPEHTSCRTNICLPADSTAPRAKNLFVGRRWTFKIQVT